MALDAQVDEYLETLRTHSYRDGQEYKDGTVALQEMTFAAESLIKSKRIHYNKVKSFLNTRLVRLGLLKDELTDLIETTQMQGKYDVFVSNAKSLYNVSASMDEMNAIINVTVASFLKKVNNYNREEEEITKRLTIINNILNYYITAKSTLIELREKIAALSEQSQ